MLVSFWLLIRKIPGIGTNLVQKSSSLPTETEKPITLNGSGNDFVKVDLAKKELVPGEKLPLECPLPATGYLIDYWLISEKSESSASFTKYYLGSKLEIPTAIPSGNYFARVDLLSLENLALQGGCSTGVFSVINEKSLVESINLVNPVAKTGLIPKAIAPFNLFWEITSKGSIPLLAPKLVVNKISEPEKVFFEEEYPAISFTSAGKKRIETNLVEFGQTGAFKVRLELYDESGILISVSPTEEIFFGTAPAINGIEVVSVTNGVLQVSLLLDEDIAADPSLYIRMFAADQESAKCGQKDYDLNYGWPKTLAVSYTENQNVCQASEVEIYLRVKGVFDRSLDFFKEKLPK